MPKYALFFTYTSEAWDGMVGKPERDRAAYARAVIEAADGEMQAIYWMTGPHDGFCIFDAPNALVAGAVSVAVGSTRSFKHLETHELLTQDQLGHMLMIAHDSRPRFQPPRQRDVEPSTILSSGDLASHGDG